ncbi:hypothetical protein LRC484719_53380 [Mycobacterium riyadhense]
MAKVFSGLGIVDWGRGQGKAARVWCQAIAIAVAHREGFSGRGWGCGIRSEGVAADGESSATESTPRSSYFDLKKSAR